MERSGRRPELRRREGLGVVSDDAVGERETWVSMGVRSAAEQAGAR
jgi:hypothetical protein